MASALVKTIHSNCGRWKVEIRWVADTLFRVAGAHWEGNVSPDTPRQAWRDMEDWGSWCSEGGTRLTDTLENAARLARELLQTPCPPQA